MSSKTIYTYPNNEIRDHIQNYNNNNTRTFRHDKFLYQLLTPFGYSRSEFCRIVYDCRNNVYTEPKCTCGNDLKFLCYSSGYQQYCSVKCQTNSPKVLEKRKETCLKNHNTEHPFQSPEVQEKRKETMLKNYGVEHSMQSPEIKEKTIQTWLKNYGVEHPFQSSEIQEKSKQTCLKNHVVEFFVQTEEFKEKSKQTMLERHGVENPMQSLEIQEKRKETCLNKYSVEYSLQSPEVQEKSKQTCLNKYGVENPMQYLEVKEKHKQTMLDRHGVEHPSQSPEIQEKSKQTCLKNHGVEYPPQSPEVQEKSKQTCLNKYGVEHPMHSPEIFEKQQNSSFKYKEHRGFQCQGYESKAIDFLIDILNVNPENITTSRSEIPSISYIFEDKKHIYFPDIKIKSNDVLIEVKSTYTWKADYDKNLTKMKASNAILMIFNETSRLPLIYFGKYPDENLNLF